MELAEVKGMRYRTWSLEPEVKNNYEQEIIFDTFLAYNQVFSTESLDCWTVFSNLYRGDSSKREYLVNPTFSLQFFAFSPQKLIIRTQTMVNKHLAFLVNVLFKLKCSFRVFSVDECHSHTFNGVGYIPPKL